MSTQPVEHGRADGSPASAAAIVADDDLFARLHLLATEQAEGRLTAEGAARLEAMVLGDPAARRLYVDHVRDTASLRWYAGGAATELAARYGHLPLATASAVPAVPPASPLALAGGHDLIRLDDDEDDAETVAARGAGHEVGRRDGPVGRPAAATFGDSTLNMLLGRSMAMPAVSAELLAATPGDGGDDEPAPLPSPAPIPMSARPRFDRRRVGRRSAVAAVAMVALAGGGWWVANRPPAPDGGKVVVAAPTGPAAPVAPAPAAPVPVATLVADAGAVWDESAWPDGRAPLVADRMFPGPWALSAGAVRFTMDGGADVIVRGPARFDLPSGRQVSLTSGRLTAHAGPGAAGFAVVTPAAKVVDLGTEFGVAVGADGATEAHVLVGRVSLAAARAAGPPVAVSARAAGRVEAAGQAVAAVPFRPGDFAHGLPLIDLADVVAGGDGTQARRGAGVDVATGAPVSAPPAVNQLATRGDGQFRAVPGRPMVAGVFIPVAGDKPATLDPAGHTFDRFPIADGASWYWLWAGGPVPMLDPRQGFDAYPTILGGVDYAAPGRGLLFMQANKGVTFDLAALRAAHPSRRFRQFKSVCGNTADQVERAVATDKSDVWVFVDGKLAFSRHPMLRGGPPADVAVDLPQEARYLTLVVTDGGDRLQSDWVTFGDPRLE